MGICNGDEAGAAVTTLPESFLLNVIKSSHCPDDSDGGNAKSTLNLYVVFGSRVNSAFSELFVNTPVIAPETVTYPLTSDHVAPSSVVYTMSDHQLWSSAVGNIEKFEDKTASTIESFVVNDTVSQPLTFVPVCDAIR